MVSKRSARACLAVLGAVLGSCGPSDAGLDEAPGARQRRDAVEAPFSEPSLVKDLAPDPSGQTHGSDPRRFLPAGDTLFIAGSDLWAYTEQGSHAPRIGGASPMSANSELITLGDELFLLNSFGSMARTDGTDEGTVRLSPDSFWYGGQTRGVCRVGDALYLSLVEMPAFDWELWRYTRAEGFSRVKNIRPTGSGMPDNLVALANGTFFFTAEDGVHGQELWVSDGTETGTRLVKDLVPGSAPSSPRNLVAAGDLLYFTVNDALWRSDGTEEGTSLVQSASSPVIRISPSTMTAVSNRLYFSGSDSASGWEPWTSDGTAAGTYRVKDLITGSRGSNPTQFRALEGHLVFLAEDLSGVQRVWRSDGTAAGTVLLSDLRALGELAVAGSRFYVRSDTCDASLSPPCGLRLWSGDGSGAPPTPLQVFTQLSLSGASASGDVLSFSANDGAHGLEPWRTDGTAAGTWMLEDLNSKVVINSIDPVGGVAVGSSVVFGSGPLSSMWRSDGSAAGTGSLPGSPTLYWTYWDQRPLVTGGVMYFSGTASSGAELWRSDGTQAGTWLVKDLVPGANSSQPRFLSTLGDRFFFHASAGTSGHGLWVSDGTAAGTSFIKDIDPSSVGWGSADDTAASLGGALYFAAADGVTGAELWKSDGTAQGTVRVADLVPGTASSNPASLTRFQDAVFFLAAESSSSTAVRALHKVDSATGAVVKLAAPVSFVSPLIPLGDSLLVFTTTHALWKWDGATQALSEVVPANTFTRNITSSFAPAGNQLFFLAQTSATGSELWRTDGTAAGTRLVKDILPGTGAGVGWFAPMVGLPEYGRVLLSATDGVHGEELWVSDGTESGTRMVKDLHPSGSSSPGMLVRAGNGVFFSADDGPHGRELWRLPLPALPGDAPPVVTCPAPEAVEALSASGAPVSWPPATATDDHTASPRVTYSAASGSVFPVGTTVVSVRAEDDTGNVSFCDFPVTVRDTTPPGVTCPADKTVVATSVVGATVFYDLARATDSVTASPEVTYSHPSGVLFPVGETRVTATAADAAGNTRSCTFRVTVTDGSRPWITCPASVTAEATSSAGAPVSFAATAGDELPGVTVTYSTAPGSRFALGNTMVTATARDVAGNTSTCSFWVKVTDSTAPQVTCPADFAQEATGASGASVTYSAQASDSVTIWPRLRYSPAPGNTLPLGTTRVTATATDEAGNAGTCSFNVTVRDTLAPVVTCPADQLLELTGPGGASTTFSASAKDAVSGSPSVTYSHASGGLFSLGETVVTASSTDAAGNTGTCSFRVTVRDTQKPVLTCPSGVVVEASSAESTSAFYPSATVSDLSGAVTVTYSQPSGSGFSLGVTKVSVGAADSSGNASACSFTVWVRDTTAPVLTCPQEVRLEASSASGAVGTFSVSAMDAVTASPALTFSHASGSTFHLGTTTVTVTARDAAGLSSTCSFPVKVVDTTKPFLDCTAPLFIEAASAAGTPVTYDWVRAWDSVSGVTLSHSVPPGSVFPLGETAVTVLAIDAADNIAACFFRVRVVDSLAPALTCPVSLVAEASGPQGAQVGFTVTAVDAVTASPRLEYSHAPGGVFPVGTTQVTVTAWDEADNHRACSFPVTVRDTTKPTLTCPASVTVEATGATGTPVNYGEATASDAVSAVTLGYSRPSGARFPTGSTPVTVTARDVAGNEATCAFDVTVRDTTAPVVTCPANLVREAEGPEGVAVSFVATVRDAGTSRLVPTYSHAPGSVFPPGQTRVSVSARDSAGNTGTCSFLVSVVNTRAASH
ncbi:ELWxxDGT repeat protein [Melittangium boletus]|uniref:HYR domain-containing protein n=1 Tax=Melittangium boletus DSM 14713 TaxID=1294270 RepID=A0A250IC74_9BACT|nr:ELWxxDGT repeat protein [Melittangium boletus]ATB29454.1 hypothetical protein MEBOL_002903 [Melittangium boletus DSM 14713]